MKRQRMKKGKSLAIIVWFSIILSAEGKEMMHVSFVANNSPTTLYSIKCKRSVESKRRQLIQPVSQKTE